MYTVWLSGVNAARVATPPNCVCMPPVAVYRYTNCRIGSVITSVEPSGDTASTVPVTDGSCVVKVFETALNVIISYVLPM